MTSATPLELTISLRSSSCTLPTTLDASSLERGKGVARAVGWKGKRKQEQCRA